MSPSPLRILGISTLGRSSAAALLDEHSVLFAVEEEKLNRLQDFPDVPRLAVERALADSKLELSALRGIALAVRESSGKSGNRPRTEAHEQLIQLLRGGPRISTFDHHLCHAASAYYTSGMDRALVLSLDEGAGGQSGLIATAEDDDIRALHKLKFPTSFGWFYTRATELVGLRPHRDEHKLQWLSEGGQPEFLPAFRKLFDWNSQGLPALNRRYFLSGADRRGVFSPKFYRELGLSARAKTAPPELRANIARSAQAYLEECVLHLAKNFREETGHDHLCLAGGLFQNVLLVRALELRGGFRDVYVQPVAGNAGTALGAAYLLRKRITGHSGRKPLDSLALGPASDSQQTKAVLDNCKITYHFLNAEDELIDQVTQLLQRDKIVGWCQGRTEFGHRALGHRSLLASPFSEYVIENINQFIKHREAFHPFAFSVPAERAAEYFDVSRNARFMASLATLKRSVPGLERFANHGNQFRIHTVEREANPMFWRLLHKFGESAPAPLLVNTSFNLFGEPLVTDPRGAVRSFYCAGVDALALGWFLLVK
jgi:carbamoyltransferase